jgi:hypothetical protein
MIIKEYKKFTWVFDSGELKNVYGICDTHAELVLMSHGQSFVLGKEIYRWLSKDASYQV